MRIRIITVSDRAASGVYKDTTGPAICSVLNEHMDDVELHLQLVPDEAADIRAALENSSEVDIIITAGGTGIGPRDITPELLEEWGERRVPGIAELLRARSLEQTQMAALSRLTAVQRGRTLAISLPGSRKAALFCVQEMIPLLHHAVSMMGGGDHQDGRIPSSDKNSS